MALDLAAAKAAFFDRAAVADRLDPAVKKALSKFGAFVRQRSRSSIRTAPMADADTGAVVRGQARKGRKVRPAVAPPGRPPYSHVGTLKRFIFFGYDPGRKSTVIGPALAAPASGAPRTLEEGGTGRTSTGALAEYEPRPYMKPAFDAELRGAGNDFKNLIR